MPYPTKKLGEIAEVSAGNSAPQDKKYFSEGTIPFFRTADVGKVHFSTDLSDAGDFLNKEAVETLGLKIWPTHTILFPKSGASTFLNHRVMIGADGVVSSHLATIFIENDILQKYIFYFLITIDAKTLTADQGYPSLRISDLQKLKILLPPLATQKQIVERLDKITEAQKLNDRLIKKTDELFQSLLHKELNLAGKDWEVKKLVEVADFLDNLRKPVTASDRVSGPYPYYGANGQQDSVGDYIFDDELVLLAEDGGYFGSKTRPVAYRVSGKCWINNHAHVLRNKNEISDIDFLGYSLMFYDVTPYITGSTRAKLNKSAAEKIKISLPSLNIQKQIVAKLSAVQDYKKQLLEQKAKLKELFDSVLAKSMKN